jgi:hypothetical protein
LNAINGHHLNMTVLVPEDRREAMGMRIMKPTTELNAERAKRKRARRDRVRIFAFLSAVLCVFPLFVKQEAWWEDGRGPNHRTAEWLPYRRYSNDIEEGLAILGKTNNADVQYLRSRGNPIHFIPGTSGRMGDTTPEGVIELPIRLRDRPVEIAVVLSHEIFHAERHDPIEPPPEHSLLRRLLWHSEEEDAHTKGLWMAIKLWRRGYHAVWHLLGFQWLLELFLYPFAVSQAALMWFLTLLAWLPRNKAVIGAMVQRKPAVNR